MRYVGFLRAVNVGGRVVRMEELRGWLETAKLKNVQTVIQSGNVVFDSPSRMGPLEKKIAQTLKTHLGYEVETFLRSIDELQEVVAHGSRLLAEAGGEGTLYIGFMHDERPAEIRDAVEARATDTDLLSIHARELYWIARGRFSDSPLASPLLEKTLKTPLTVRNVSTLRRIVAKFT